jgi:hypothetical protein
MGHPYNDDDDDDDNSNYHHHHHGDQIKDYNSRALPISYGKGRNFHTRFVGKP